MKIGIISDTHDQIDNIKKAVKIFNKEKIDLVYHLGDWCSPFTLHLFKDLRCSLKGIFGNNDADIYKMIKYKPGNIEFFDKFYVDTINGKSICLFHGDPAEIVERLYESKKYDMLLTGHDHAAIVRNNEKTININPGNLIGKFSEETKEWTKPSVAIYDFNKVKIIKV